MKLNRQEKEAKNILVKQAKNYKDKNKIIHAIDFLIDKDISPTCIELKQNHVAINNYAMDYDLVVYKDSVKKTPENIIFVVKFYEDFDNQQLMTNLSYNYFSSMPNLFFMLFYLNDKKTILTFKNIVEDRVMICKTENVPSFKQA